MIQRISDLDQKHTKMTLQLANTSITRPSRIIEDVLVNMDKFLFSVDFVVMDIEDNDDVPLILGRPFLKTARIMIDIYNGLIKVWVPDKEVSFKLFKAMKHSKDNGVSFKIDDIGEAIMDVHK